VIGASHSHAVRPTHAAGIDNCLVSRYVELSHPVTDGMLTHPGLPPPHITDHVRRTKFHIGRIELVGNTGTYVDAPFHYRADGVDVAGLPLERLLGIPIVVVRALGRHAVTAAHLADAGELWGRAVLIHTGWDRFWGTPQYLRAGPHLDGGAARALVEANVACVGIDSVNIDDLADQRRPVHTMLLDNDIPIIEHLTGLSAVPDTGARLYALPAPIVGLGSFPVRAVAAL
jgi:arylformamidase